MFDVFIKLSEYSLVVKCVVVGWIIFCAFLAVVILFAKPVKKEILGSQSATIPEISTQSAGNQFPPTDGSDVPNIIIKGNAIMRGNKGGGIYVGAGYKIHADTITAEDNGGQGVRTGKRGEIKASKIISTGNAKNGIHVEGDGKVKADEIKTSNNGENGINIINKPPPR